MATYRNIHTSFWQDTFVLDLTPEEKYFYLYLMTNSKTTQCGVYELPKKVMDLMQNSTSDQVRQKAAQDILDRYRGKASNFVHHTNHQISRIS